MDIVLIYSSKLPLFVQVPLLLTYYQVVQLKRNFGHEIAMTAGMDYAKGDAVIFMDADLQHPPVYVPKMIELWQQGNEIVLTSQVAKELLNGEGNLEDLIGKEITVMTRLLLNHMMTYEVETTKEEEE